MTDQERLELREWSATQVMGWIWNDEHEIWVVDSERDVDGRLTYCCPDELPGYEIEIIHGDAPDWRQTPWTPDLDMNQAFMVDAAMNKAGWDLMTDRKGSIFYATYYCEEHPWRLDSPGASGAELGTTILKAAKAALAREENERR